MLKKMSTGMLMAILMGRPAMVNKALPYKTIECSAMIKNVACPNTARTCNMIRINFGKCVNELTSEKIKLAVINTTPE